MINAVHTLIYSDDPEATRAFFRDVLGWPFVEEPDVPGWLIFKTGPSELGVHPTDGDESSSGTHDISFFTDDVKGTVKELAARGVKFDDTIADHGYGFVTHFTMPGGVRVQLYEPKYTKKAAR